VVTDLHGVTGRDIMDHLIAGERNPKVLAQLARRRARRKISQLEEALEGAEFFTPEHAVLLAKILARIDRLTADIDDLTEVIERLLAPYEEQLAQAEAGARLGTARRPGRRRRDRRGHDQVPHRRPPGLLGRPRPAGPPVRYARRTRQDQEGQPLSRRTARRDRRGGGPHPDPRRRPREGARHRRLARRRGAAKACVATGNTQLKVYHKLLSNPGMRYEDLGPDYYERRRDLRRQVAHHVGKLGSLGFEVTLCRIPEPDPDETAPTQAA
jgi:transposase